jgi:hypothetical protein
MLSLFSASQSTRRDAEDLTDLNRNSIRITTGLVYSHLFLIGVNFSQPSNSNFLSCFIESLRYLQIFTVSLDHAWKLLSLSGSFKIPAVMVRTQGISLGI